MPVKNVKENAAINVTEYANSKQFFFSLLFNILKNKKLLLETFLF